MTIVLKYDGRQSFKMNHGVHSCRGEETFRRASTPARLDREDFDKSCDPLVRNSPTIGRIRPKSSSSHPCLDDLTYARASGQTSEDNLAQRTSYAAMLIDIRGARGKQKTVTIIPWSTVCLRNVVLPVLRRGLTRLHR